MLLKIIKNKNKKKYEIKKESAKPITIKDMEEAIKLIEAAMQIKCEFKVCIGLKMDELVLDSEALKGIQIIKNKKEGDKVLIKYQNVLFSSDTYIDLDNIIEMNVECHYRRHNEADLGQELSDM